MAENRKMEGWRRRLIPPDRTQLENAEHAQTQHPNAGKGGQSG
jgi:hypothetical protein